MKQNDKINFDLTPEEKSDLEQNANLVTCEGGAEGWTG